MSDYCEMRTMRTLFAEAKGGNNVTSSIFANVACMVKMRKSEGISTQTALTSNSAVECISDIVSNTFFSERENRDRITAIVLLFPHQWPVILKLSKNLPQKTDRAVKTAWGSSTKFQNISLIR